ncbi:DUF6265 family protein [Avrilella dinanensis]|uniref:DUF6265 family protein n=1 Tax=Avrilella dinanensis TaxID=2008672 RepID=UPI001A9C7417|nr:DUF6265 family protein [Avrilella dinanensis]
MKKILILLTGALVLSCNQKTKTNQTEDSKTEPETTTEITKNTDWLIGDWKRINDRPEQETFESWTKISPREYSGFGYTMQQKDTISQEKMTLLESDGKWSLFVKIPGEKEATEFKITELKDNEFVCVNEANDFPKKIEYRSEGGMLTAKISDENVEIPFEFERIKK